MTDQNFAQWQALLIKYSVSEAAAKSVFGTITAAYGETGRYYHTLSHIYQVLKTADELKHLANDYTAVQLAIWFHDIVYNPKTTDNEVKSADYAQSLLTTMAIPPDTIQKVSQLILATASHRNPGGDIDTAILLDADLAVLGSDGAAFAAYCQAIRLEYRWVPEAVYRTTRVGILTKFLNRPFLYHTPLLRARLESRARENLEREIDRLS